MKKSHGFLKFDGINGIVTEENHKGWINISSCSFNMSQNSHENMYSKATGGGSTSTTVSNITCTREMDKSSVLLMQASGKGDLSNECIIEFVKDSHKGNASLYYKLMNARISNYSPNINDESTWKETFTISFSNIRCMFTPFSSENEKESPSIYDHKL